MNDALNQRLRAELHELADGGRPVDLADAALRGAVRRRRTRSALAICAAVAIVAVTTFTVAGPEGRDARQPASGAATFVVSSFHTAGQPGTYLLDPRTGGYTLTSYSWAVVSPDARSAAVLPDLGPGGKPAATRIGIVDLRTRAVGWVTTPEPVWAPVWSADGRTVLVTVVPAEGIGSGPSTGFLRLDVASGRLTNTPVTGQPPVTGPFLWGPDGTTVICSTDAGSEHVPTGRPGGPTVYDLNGRQLRHLDVPASVLTLDPWSPSGRLLVLDGAAAGGRPQQLVVDAATGRVVARVDTPHPTLGWRDDAHLLVRTDEGAVQSVEIASGARRNLATLPRRDIDDVFLTPAEGLSAQARKNGF